MFETPISVIGNIVNHPVRHRVGDREVMRFRVASNSRRRTAEGTWEPGNTLFVSVSCWGKLVTGVGAALCKGDAVIVVGHVYTSEYDDREGNRRTSVEVRATSVGPDLSRCIVRVEKRLHGNGGDEAGEPTPTDPAPVAPESGLIGTNAEDTAGAAVDPDGLPLTA